MRRLDSDMVPVGLVRFSGAKVSFWVLDDCWLWARLGVFFLGGYDLAGEVLDTDVSGLEEAAPELPVWAAAVVRPAARAATKANAVFIEKVEGWIATGRKLRFTLRLFTT